MSKKLLGIDLGGTTVKFGILTSEGEVQEKWAIETNTLENGRHIVPNIVESLKHRLEMYGLTAEDFIGIGMGSPGAVDRENKTVTGAFNLNWAETQEVGSVIEKELGIPFAIDNDANVAALGERWVGAGANNPDVVFVTLGTGVGGGVIADGNLIHGVGGAGGEIGHIHVRDEEWEHCNCGGVGCVEQICSATGIAREARRKMEASDKPSALREYGADVTAKDVLDAAKAGDELANEVMDVVGRYLALALSMAVMIVDPEIFVIGGGVSKAGQFLIDVIQKHYDYFTPISKYKGKLGLATLGNDAGIYGAARLVL